MKALILEERLKLSFRDIDIDELGAAVNAIDMIVEVHRLMIERDGRFIHAVAEIAGALVHGHHHLLDGRGAPPHTQRRVQRCQGGGE